MKRTNIHLTYDQRRKLIDYSKKIGLTPAAIVRLAINHYLKRVPDSFVAVKKNVPKDNKE